MSRRRFVIWSRSLFMSLPDGHRAHLPLEARECHHGHMHNEKEHQHHEQDKVNRPCGLRTAEEIQQSRIRRCNRRGHREPRQDYERERNENDAGVAELLQEAVRWPAASPWYRKSRMCGDVAPQMPRCKLSKAGDEVAPEVPACESHDQVHQAGQDEEPGCQEVEATPPAILVEDVVCARGTDDGTVAREKRERGCPPAVLVVAANRQLDERGREIVACLAPVQPRMHNEDLEARKHKREDTRGDDPVSEPHPGGVSRLRHRGLTGRNHRDRYPSLCPPICSGGGLFLAFRLLWRHSLSSGSWSRARRFRCGTCHECHSIAGSGT